MVTLTRLTGSVFALNSDLIERVDSTPDTVITLVDGTKYLVREPLEEVVDRVRRYRGSVIAAASHLDLPQHDPEDDLPVGPRRLTAVPALHDAGVVPFPFGEA
ncbi:MAG: flagellar FlbD family protein [Actinomycetota bacterium]|nr:flagellar FlbD family protein [Actinomycetota bacterium]